MTTEDLKSETKSKWLDAHYDPVASLYTFTHCITLSDVRAEGDWKLVIADLGTGTYDMKLKVYQGTHLMAENTIIDLPTGVATIYIDTHEPRTPAIAVASGPYLYVYKNLRPYYKFSLPSLEINAIERDLWEQVKQEKISVSILREMLNSLREEGVTLTVQSLKLLQLEDINMVESYIDSYKSFSLKRQTVITCLGTLKKSAVDEDAVSFLVFATEDRSMYILDTAAFNILESMSLPSVPVFLSITGLYDVEYRIIVSCRNGHIYMLKRGSTTGKLCVELNSQPVGLVRLNKTIIVGCMDNTLQSFTTKGKRLWTVKLPASVMTMELLEYKAKGIIAVMVSLSNCTIHIYRNKSLVDVIVTPDVVTGIKFGRFGREEGNLILTTRGGGLIIKILRRNADFEEKNTLAGPPTAQNIKLAIPKKTKLFVDQTVRERENAVAMHRTFQRDVYLLRLKAARQYVHTLENNLNPISSDPIQPLKLSAQVQGIGPVFKLTLKLQNTSLHQASRNLFITFEYSEKLYCVKQTYIPVPCLVPGLDYSFSTFVECRSDRGMSDDIKVFVFKENGSSPLITALISMPISEGLIVV